MFLIVFWSYLLVLFIYLLLIIFFPPIFSICASADQEANSQGAPNMVKQKYNSSYGITKLHVDNFLHL
jgi:hypothetical protein